MFSDLVLTTTIITKTITFVYWVVLRHSEWCSNYRDLVKTRPDISSSALSTIRPVSFYYARLSHYILAFPHSTFQKSPSVSEFHEAEITLKPVVCGLQRISCWFYWFIRLVYLPPLECLLERRAFEVYWRHHCLFLLIWCDLLPEVMFLDLTRIW